MSRYPADSSRVLSHGKSRELSASEAASALRLAEAKSVKNRMHWDVDLTAPGPDALVAAGARVLREPDEEIFWWVLADPEGSEFCAFPPASDD